MTRTVVMLVSVLPITAAGCVGRARINTLGDRMLALKLGVDTEGSALIRQAAWGPEARPTHRARRLLEGLSVPDGLGAWVPADILPAPIAGSRTAEWRITEGNVFRRAKLTRDLSDGLTLTWVVELAKQGTSFRMHVRLANGGNRARSVEWFPGWTGRWRLPGGVARVRGWRALSFQAAEEPLAPGRSITFGSRLHSSDTRHTPGMNPYWRITGKETQLYFALDWCGGWQATLTGRPEGLDFSVRLPPSETQLTLAPGQAIAGPVVTVTAVATADDAIARAAWMTQRAALARDLYGGPEPSYPLTYNNWYTTRFNLDGAFLRRQVAAMAPYRFDYFIVDAGWYQKVGEWTPHPDKFKPGEFEAILRSVRAKGVKVGIWSCPQFIAADKDALPKEVDRPGLYEKFIDGHLLDLVGCDYPKRLAAHVAMLRKRYLADWWKYDQLLFADRTRAGVMRNVVAFQEALLAVRRANPDLIIENCQSGGRMTNELTMLVAQSQWLRDGGSHGLIHARSNVSVALNALAFVPPWAAGRWTNNFQKMDPKDDELTRFYCRSAMAGTWGIVSDLAKIPERQRAVILQEIEHYRRLNAFKPGYLYDLHLPRTQGSVAGVTFYKPDRTEAAVLLYRWDRRGALDPSVKLPSLQTTRRYEVTDVDSGERRTVTGQALNEPGLSVNFPAERRSALLFVEACK